MAGQPRRILLPMAIAIGSQLLNHRVSYPRPGQDVPGVPGVIPELLPESGHVYLEQMGIAEVRAVPDVLQYLVRGDHPPRVARQIGYQFVLDSGQIYLPAAQGDAVSGKVNYQVADADLRLGTPVPGAGAPQHRPHPGYQLPGEEGLGHIFVGTGIQPFNPF